jgi:ferredoxin
MTTLELPIAEHVLPRVRLSELFAALVARGFRVVGPKFENGVIGYAELRGAEELPEGWTDEQAPGRYRAIRREDASLFGYAVGQRSFRDFFQVPETGLVALRRAADGPSVLRAATDERPLALFGARACDLHAIDVQDRVLSGGTHPDARYVSRRRNAFVVAVNCTEPSSVCFCVSMGTGPRAEGGFDLSLTELLDESGHRFVVRAGSESGARLIEELGLGLASEADRGRDVALVESARGNMGRTLVERGVREALLDHLDHPEWDRVAERCLACTNCTLVCPTCFCTTTDDGIDVTGELAERRIRHDSCFSLEYSHLHGAAVRTSVKSRYRQWLTHKFATWYDQFGSSGCVGCGRCITFCPVGIDVTEEIAEIRGETPAD